jgi:hypothetical protein
VFLSIQMFSRDKYVVMLVGNAKCNRNGSEVQTLKIFSATILLEATEICDRL